MSKTTPSKESSQEESLPQLPDQEFNPVFASMYGVNESILIGYFQLLINSNQRNGLNLKVGRTWACQTRVEIASHFPYFSERQVRTITENLVKKGVLIKDNFNRLAMEKTLWYAFENEEKFTDIRKN